MALLRHHRQLVQAWRVEVLVGCVGWHRKHWGGICLAMAFIILARHARVLPASLRRAGCLAAPVCQMPVQPRSSMRTHIDRGRGSHYCYRGGGRV